MSTGSGIEWTDATYSLIAIHDDPDDEATPVWRWLAVVRWYGDADRDGYPRMVCRRHPCPLRLMRWVCAMVLSILRRAGA